MSLTESEKEELLRRFYRLRLAATAEVLRARGVSFFPLGPAPGASTYYKERSGPAALITDQDAQNIETRLQELWSRQGLGELAALAPELVSLAKQLAEAGEESGDVSPYLYVMF
jgi:hypothetical protein